MLARIAALGLSVALVTVAASTSAAGEVESRDAAQARSPSRIAGAYIVVYRPSVEGVKRKTDRLERELGFTDELRYRHAIEGFAAELSPEQAKRLEADPAIASLEPDRPVEAFGSVPLAAGEPTPPTGVRRIEAATSSTVREASTVNVAVIDTGIDLLHPDINAATGTNCLSAGASAQDDNGHGTHVAGTIAAKNNGAGVVGVAPGTKVYAAKVLDKNGSGSWSQVICGIDWVTGTRTDGDPDNNIAVANMSLGGLGGATDNKACGASSALHEAICRSTAAGVTYTVAAGNDAWAFPHSTLPDVPAAYPEVITVTAVADSDGQGGAAGPAPSCRTGESDDRYASFSNYSNNTADNNHTIAAPGVCITSTWINGGYNTISGTSMASPHVAGLVALCLGESGASGPCSGLNAAQIIQKVRADAEGHTTATLGYGFNGDPLSPVTGRYFGYLSWVQPQGTVSPPPPSSRTGSPDATVIQTGSYRAGTVADLGADDNRYYEVNSTTSGTRTSAWYGSFTAVPKGLSSLKVAYKGKNSRSCTQRLSIKRWGDGAWVPLNSRSVGTSEVLVEALPVGSAADYVSGTTDYGELQLRVECTTSKSFYARGDLMRIAYNVP